MELWTAFVIGLMGSLHCAGMCGPIVMVLPLTAEEKHQVIWQAALYHLGRVSSYGMMGLVMGILGWSIAWAGYQKDLALVLGISFLIAAISFVIPFTRAARIPGLRKFHNGIKSKLSSMLTIRSSTNAAGIGFLNGFLPCGLVYFALAGALSGGDILFGVLYMTAFGLGTTPLLIGMMYFRNLGKIKRLSLNKWLPVGLAVFAVILIYRGLQVQVPADLKLWLALNFPIMCH